MDKYCQNCHQANPADASFCRNCSAVLPSNQSGGQQGNQQFHPPNVGNQANFGNQPVSMATPTASTRAIVALVLAIASLFCCGIPAIPAAIVGWMEINAIKRGESPQAGMTMAQVGLWGGIVMTILSVIGGFIWLLMMASADPYYYY